MKVEELVAKSPVDEISITIAEKDEPREVRGGQLKVCDCVAKDETGTVTFTLWNEDIEKVDVGDTVTIKKGWVNEFQGKKQLSKGRFGEMEVKKGDASKTAEKEEEQPKEVLDAVEEDII